MQQTQLSRYERGVQLPDLETRLRIEAALEVEAGYLERAAGLSLQPESFAEFIAGIRQLSDRDRRYLLALFNEMVN
jgi:transcriptional regulator with XRE-family HTH domain